MCKAVKALENTCWITVWPTGEKESVLFSLFKETSNGSYLFLPYVSQLFCVVQGI